VCGGGRSRRSAAGSAVREGGREGGRRGRTLCAAAYEKKEKGGFLFNLARKQSKCNIREEEE